MIDQVLQLLNRERLNQILVIAPDNRELAIGLWRHSVTALLLVRL